MLNPQQHSSALYLLGNVLISVIEINYTFCPEFKHTCVFPHQYIAYGHGNITHLMHAQVCLLDTQPGK